LENAPPMNEPQILAPPREIHDLLMASPFAQALRSDTPLLVVAGDPARLLFHNRAALGLLGASGPEQLSSAVLAGEGQGARHLRRLAARASESAPKLELLRFFTGRMPVQIALVCATLKDARGDCYGVAAAPPLKSTQGEDARQFVVTGAAAPDPEAARATQPARFVWASDAEGRFGAPSRQLLDSAGTNAPREGETIDQWRERVRADSTAEFARAMTGRATFGSVSALWLDADGKQNLVALMSGSPVFDRRREFLGYRGFGVFTGAIEPRARSSAASSPADAAPAQVAQESAAVLPASPARGAEVVPLRPAIAPPSARPNVVPLRPGPMRIVNPENPARNGSDSVALTTDERDAFREIALALGARMPARGDNETNAEFDPPEARSRGARAPEAAGLERDLIDLSGTPEPPAQTSGAEPLQSDRGSAIAAADARRLLDSLPIGALVSRGDQALYLNLALLDLLGYRDIEEFSAASGVAQMFNGDAPEQAAGRGGPLSLNIAGGGIVDVDGQLQPIEWRGAPASLISLRRSLDAESIQKLQALEDEARRLEAQLHDAADLLDQASDGIVGIDSAGRVVSLSGRAETLLAIKEEEALGNDFTELLREEHRAAAAGYFDALQRGAQDGAALPGLEAATRERDGRVAPILLVLFRSGAAGPESYHAILRDRTPSQNARHDSEKALKEARKASALKTDMLAAISHEIRTPLNAILGFTEVMRDERFGPVGNERYKQYVNDIHLSGQHVLSLVNDLLDLSKIEAGKFEVNFVPLEANRIIQECVALMQPHAARERIIVRLSLSDKLPPIAADERSLRQIILNLLSNAVKFNEPGGQVIVSTALSEANQAIIRVRDTGIGMSEAELGVALEPFRQIVGARRIGGTGLGLPLTKALVEANKADFSIHSRKEQGTLVELTFPIAHAAAAQ
jgi:PAS domain S-box-containing protein